MMKAKRLLLTLLVALASVFSAWAATEVDYTILSSTSRPSTDIYTDINVIKQKDGFVSFYSPATIVVDAHRPFCLDKCILTTRHYLFNSATIEGSNDYTDDSSWTLLQTVDETFEWDVPKSITTDSTTPYRYYRFKFIGNVYATVKQIQLFEASLEGDGTAENPLKVSGVSELILLPGKLVQPAFSDAHVAIMDDIDMKGREWVGIGILDFHGTIDGGNHVIKNLKSKDGMFQSVGACTVKNLGFVDCNITASAFNTAVGSFAGVAYGITFTNCFAQGTFAGVPEEEGAPIIQPIGGLVGLADNDATFTNCYSVTNIVDDAAPHNPVCGVFGTATFNDCYFYGTTSTASGTAVTKEEVLGGRLAYMMNGYKDDVGVTWFQKIGTDKSPVLVSTGNNYVFLSLDGTSFSNKCPHRIAEEFPMVVPSCLETTGHAAYGKCSNGLCGKLFLQADHNIEIKDAKELTLSYKPVVIEEHLDGPDKTYGEFVYKDSIRVNGVDYYNAMELSFKNDSRYTGLDYSVAYTFTDNSEKMDMHYFVDSSIALSEIEFKIFINNIEHPEYHYSCPDTGKSHKKLELDNLNKYDVIKVVCRFIKHSPVISSGDLLLTIATTTRAPEAHDLKKVEADYNCISGGYLQHYQCNRCNYVFADNVPDSDAEIKDLDYFALAPVGSHNFGLWNHQDEGNLWSSRCQNDYCSTIDPEHQFILKDYHNGNDMELTYDGVGYTAVEPVALADAKAYNSSVPFHAGEVSYARSFYPLVWNSWFMPFSVSTETLALNGVTSVGCLENIINYDTDYDGVIDKTVLEVILKKNGTLKSGIPYLVKPGLFYDNPMIIGESQMVTSDDVQVLHTESISASYSITGSYNGESYDMAFPCTSYALTSEGLMDYTTDNGIPMRWYVHETLKDSPYADDVNHGEDCQLVISVIGEEDEPTGVRTLYSHPSEEVINGIYDLHGRRQPAMQKGINIVGGKKIMVK